MIGGQAIRNIFRWASAGLIVWALMLCVMPTRASAAATDNQTPPANRGLFITPIRQYVTVSAGTAKAGNFTVANYTDKPMAISFSIKQFSVADYNYDFKFDEPVGNKLVSITAPDAILQPGENKIIPYLIDIPLGSTPGGRYYTILATATSTAAAKSGFQEQVQAASLVYLTIDGKLSYANNIGATTVQRVAFGSAIGFTMDVSNTGNTHYFMYLSAHLQGPLTSKSQVSQSHLLLPIKTRHIESSLPSPVLPGIYKLTYGYRTEYTPATTLTARILFIPPWSVAAGLLIAYAGYKLYKRKQRPPAPVTD